MRLVSALLDLIAPPRCLVCRVALEVSSSSLCGGCLRRLPWWRTADGCPRCGSRMPLGRGAEPGLFDAGAAGCPGCLADGSPLHACHALLRYEGPARSWLPGFKRRPGPFGPPPELAGVIGLLSRELAVRARGTLGDPPDALVPIPLHAQRRRERGFNQAEWIARTAARELGCRPRPGWLLRVRPTPPQAGLQGRSRRENVRLAFRTGGRIEPGLRIWLIDDVLTTGSTLEAAADCLLAAGAEEVSGLALAATLPARRRANLRGEDRCATADLRGAAFAEACGEACGEAGGHSRIGALTMRPND
ncbi:MAG: double zinc ribbon domain-containing protein [bacterium]